MTATPGKDAIAPIELERADTPYDIHLDHKVQDGDEALKILYGEYEPYTKEEEKRVLRKIDFRLIIVMLIINGLQFIDKNVSPEVVRNVGTSLTSTDHLGSSYIWYHWRGTSRWTRIQLVDQHLLYWIPHRPVSYQSTHAALSNWQIHHHQLHIMGYCLLFLSCICPH
jgi:hypothetical protein